jgi:hypothetical protein
MAKKPKASKKLRKAKSMKQVKPLTGSTAGRFTLDVGNYNVGN